MIGDDVFKELEALDKKIRDKIVRQSQRAGAKLLADEIRSRAPVETGRTKRSVKVRAGRRKKGFISTNVVISGGHDGPFIGFVEFGTKDQEANPFIRGSAMARESDVVEAIVDGINKGIRS